MRLRGYETGRRTCVIAHSYISLAGSVSSIVELVLQVVISLARDDYTSLQFGMAVWFTER